MQVGDRVRITAPINVYHHPAHKGQPFSIQGMEGKIVEIITDWHGRVISPNYPIKVELDNRFFAHVAEHEFELVTD